MAEPSTFARPSKGLNGQKQIFSKNIGNATEGTACQWWRGGRRGTQDVSPEYHKREILQGPYKIILPLSSDVKEDRVSAEFVEYFWDTMVVKGCNCIEEKPEKSLKVLYQRFKEVQGWKDLKNIHFF